MVGNNSVLSDVVSGDKRKLNFFDPAIFTLLTGVGFNFFRFLRSLGLSADRNLVVLSSKDNYFCNEYDLKNARIIINLKKLNLIKHLDLFLNTLVLILPPNTNFIGYFSDEEALKVNGFNHTIIIRRIKRIFGLSGSRSKNNMNRNEVAELLEKNGFKTLDMKEMNGLTYFISQNVSIPR
jgi:hypothetical protein